MRKTANTIATVLNRVAMLAFIALAFMTIA
jgi:hypothetical protein